MRDVKAARMPVVRVEGTSESTSVKGTEEGRGALTKLQGVKGGIRVL